MLHDGEGRTFYAVGGTWRALARLHMWQTGYPFHVMHNYRISRARGAGILPAGASGRYRDAVEDRSGQCGSPAVARLCRAGDGKSGADDQAQDRWSFPCSACAKGCSIRCSKQSERARDPLISAAADLNVLRSRSPHHGEELIAWTDRFMAIVRPGRDRRRAAAAPCRLSAWPISAGARIRIIAASSR